MSFFLFRSSAISLRFFRMSSSILPVARVRFTGLGIGLGLVLVHLACGHGEG